MFDIYQPQSHRSTSPRPEFELAPDVVLLLANDGSARLLDMGGDFYALPRVTAEMLRRTLEHGMSDACRQVARDFGVDVDRVERDLNDLLGKLRRRGTIYRGAYGPPQWRRTFCVAALRWVVLAVMCCCPGRKTRTAALLTLAKLSFWLCGWSRTVTAWQAAVARIPLRESPDTDRAEIAAVDAAICRTAAAHPLSMACKERALTCWTMIRFLGIPAELVVGLDLFPLAGHCWCEADGRVLSDLPDRCETFSPVLRYGSTAG